MPNKPRYRVYDTVRGQYLASFVKPVKGCDVAVTRWAVGTEDAMTFKVLAAARSVAQWLNDGGGTAVAVLNERGDAV